MNSLKCYYKITDAVAQITIITTLIVLLFAQRTIPGVVYLCIAGWFAVSMVIHAFVSTEKYKLTFRKFATVATAIAGVIAAGMAVPWLLGMWFTLLFYGGIFTWPFAIIAMLFYTYTCIAEVLYMRKRPINLLK